MAWSLHPETMRKGILALLLAIFTSSYSQTDCVDAIVVCGNTEYSGLAAVGFGSQELNGRVTCSSNENNSIWLRLDIAGPGSLSFIIKPTNNDISIDYDFFVFGPNVNCGNIGQSIRCSTTNPISAGATNNWTGLRAPETDISEGPGPDGNSFLKPLDVLAGESYFLVIDRPVGLSDFSIEWTGTASFNEPPSINLTSPEALDLVRCDSDGVDDDQTAFDLTVNNNLVTGGNPGLVVTYHTNQSDAITGDSFIADPANFLNESNPQTLYARLENPITGCSNFTSFTIAIQNVITLSTTPFLLCDDAVDGDDANGKRLFNLANVSAALLPLQDLSSLDVEYYLSEGQRNSHVGELSSPFYNTNAFFQTLYVRVRNADGCEAIGDVLLQVAPIPSRVNGVLTQCEVSATPDGTTLFDLTQADALYVTGNPGLSVSYYPSTTAADSNSGALTTFENTTNPQTIIAKVTDTASGCYRLNPLVLTVSSSPTENVVVFTCDDPETEDGLSTVDLTQNGFTVAPGGAIRYYLTEQDALLEQNKIDDPTDFPNTSPYEQTVYVRLEEGTGCAAINTVTVKVNRLPQIKTEGDGDELVCINRHEFITINGGILEGVPSDYSYIWWYEENSLLRDTYAIQAYDPGTYRVAVINRFGCRKYRTIEVAASDVATIDTIAIADIATDNHTVTVTIAASSAGSYEYALDDTGNYQDSNVFENVNGGVHTIYVRDKNGCGVVEQLITVLDAPKFFTPNADGINDLWRIEASTGALSSATMIEIFTRDGKLLMTADPRNSNGWDGTYDGRPMPADDYWYHVYFSNGRMEKGHFALKR